MFTLYVNTASLSKNAPPPHPHTHTHTSRSIQEIFPSASSQTTLILKLNVRIGKE